MTPVLIPPPLDAELTEPDKHAIATNIVDPSKRKLKHAPSSADLAAAISDVQYQGQRTGASSITITIDDPEWTLLDSGLFDTDQNGQIDPIDINYPNRSRYWWRITQISPKADRTIQITCLVREAVFLMHLKGPRKWNRASVTRAQAIKAMCDSVKEGDGIEFYSAELNTIEPIDKATTTPTPTTTSPTTTPTSPTAPATASSSNAPAGQAAKTVGLGANTAGLTCKGSALSSEQISVINAAMTAGAALHAPTAALQAIIYAGMGESSLGNDASTSSNVWQANNPGNYSSVEDMATAFFQGTRDFAAPGGIACANRGDPVWMIANETENNYAWIHYRSDSYGHQWPGGQAQGLAEAVKIVAAAGGGTLAGGTPTAGGAAPGPASSSTKTTIEAYFFEVGPNENYWTAINRLAQEVDWDFFLDGNRAYYDSDTTMITQKVAYVIDRDEAAVIDWSYDWDARSIVTQMSLTVICEMFAIAPGEVVLLKRFGPASTASTVGQPGRWLVDSFTRMKSSIDTVLSLVQPAKPKNEPAPQITTSTTTTTTSSSGAGQAGTTSGAAPAGGGYPAIPAANPGTIMAVFAAAKRLSDMAIPYPVPDTHSPGTNDMAHPSPLDCSSSTTWILHQAGLFPGSDPIVSGDFETWGLPGPGQYMTVWCTSGHVFIEFNIPGIGHWQANTSPASDRPPAPPGTGSRLFPWGQNGAADALSFVARHVAVPLQ